MKNIRYLLIICCLLLQTTLVLAQNVQLPPDEVHVVDHVVQPGENFTTIWEGTYGQKFKLKEYYKYNPGVNFLKPGITLHVPVHTTDPKYLTKSAYRQVLAKYSPSVSSTAPAGSKASATVKKFKVKDYNVSEYHIYVEWKAEVKWMAGLLLGYKYVYYDETGKNVLKEEHYTYQLKKDEQVVSATEQVELDKLSHINGNNTYYVGVEFYNPQDNDAIMARTDLEAIAAYWNGNVCSAPTNGIRHNLLDNLLDISISSVTTTTANDAPAQTYQSNAPSMSTAPVISSTPTQMYQSTAATTGNSTAQSYQSQSTTTAQNASNPAITVPDGYTLRTVNDRTFDIIKDHNANASQQLVSRYTLCTKCNGKQVTKCWNSTCNKGWDRALERSCVICDGKGSQKCNVCAGGIVTQKYPGYVLIGSFNEPLVSFAEQSNDLKTIMKNRTNGNGILLSQFMENGDNWCSFTKYENDYTQIMKFEKCTQCLNGTCKLCGGKGYTVTQRLGGGPMGCKSCEGSGMCVNCWGSKVSKHEYAVDANGMYMMTTGTKVTTGKAGEKKTPEKKSGSQCPSFIVGSGSVALGEGGCDGRGTYSCFGCGLVAPGGYFYFSENPKKEHNCSNCGETHYYNKDGKGVHKCKCKHTKYHSN